MLHVDIYERSIVETQQLKKSAYSGGGGLVFGNSEIIFMNDFLWIFLKCIGLHNYEPTVNRSYP